MVGRQLEVALRGTCAATQGVAELSAVLFCFPFFLDLSEDCEEKNAPDDGGEDEAFELVSD